MYILQIKDIYKNYDNTKALNGVNINIKQGEIYGLLGPNGAGKSTLIKIIGGLENYTSGKIIYGEKETRISKYKKNLGLLPQDLAIYPDLTGRENVSFFCSLYGFKGKELKQRVDSALDFVALSEFQNKKSIEYSGGMKRRLNMACAIAHGPKLIIMDEPTVGIDPQSRNHILESVKKLNDQGVTIIYTSHYMEEVEELCKNISIMDKGRVIAQGDKEYLKSSIINNDVYIITLKHKVENLDKEIYKIKGIKDVDILGNKISCIYSKEANVLQKLINTICNHSGQIESIKNEVPNLENVFLTLTGKKLRD